MAKIFSERGFDFHIYTDDHPPAHSHVIRGSKKSKGKRTEVVIFIGDENSRPRIRKVKGMRKADVKKALSIAANRQVELIEAWRQIHGD